MARPKKSDAALKVPPQMALPQQMLPQQPGLHPAPIPPQHHVAPVMHQPFQVQPLQQQQPQQQAPQQRIIDSENFLRVRESAVGRLQMISELIRTFTQDYVRQTNLLLGEPIPEGNDNLLGNFDNAAQLLMGVPVELAPPAEPEKKERKKRTHDPNAPKRPLTPYFLYMQHARSIIANDLGAEAPKGAVQEEGQRRWASMSPAEKQGWNNAYQYNLRLYNARVHSYKHGNLTAKGMTDDEALRYADENQVPMPEIKEAAPAEGLANDQDAIAQQLQGQVPLPGLDDKTPKKTPASRKRKSQGPGDDAKASPAVATPATAAASPDKKRRRTSTKAPDATEEPKKGGRKKTKSN